MVSDNGALGQGAGRSPRLLMASPAASRQHPHAAALGPTCTVWTRRCPRCAEGAGAALVVAKPFLLVRVNQLERADGALRTRKVRACDLRPLPHVQRSGHGLLGCISKTHFIGSLNTTLGSIMKGKYGRMRPVAATARESIRWLSPIAAAMAAERACPGFTAERTRGR